MKTATATVVEGKLEPIAAAADVVAPQFTAQAAINLFADFETATKHEGTAVCSVLIRTVIQARNCQADEFGAATKGLVESTRITVDNKRQDTDRTALARKFQSMARAIWGAFRFADVSLDEIQTYGNSQALYDAARKALAERQIDWAGMLDADKEAARAKSAMRKAVLEVVSEEGESDLAAMTPEQFGAVKSKAKAKLAEKQAKAKLESMEKRAEKLADDLVKSYGFDGAEEVLKRALERLPAMLLGQAA
jgi:restriction endonuclease Mrr